MSKPDWAELAAEDIMTELSVPQWRRTQLRITFAAMIRVRHREGHAVEKPEPRDYNEREGSWE
jgi:hypothetical protein